MIISHKHKFIYIKTAKTAGTSMLVFLANQCAPGDLVTATDKNDTSEAQKAGNHFPSGLSSSFEQVKLWLWKKQNEGSHNGKMSKNLPATDAYRFLGPDVWNSYYKFCFERNPFDKAISLYFWHNRFAETMPELNEYILTAKDKTLSNWHTYTIDDQVVMDHVYQFENISEEIKNIAAKFSFTKTNLPQLKISQNRDNTHYSKLLSSQARARIEAACFREIEYFQYRWENN
jgi:hypothetical protein